MGLEDRLAFLITAEGAQAIGTFGKVRLAAKEAADQTTAEMAKLTASAEAAEARAAAAAAKGNEAVAARFTNQATAARAKLGTLESGAGGEGIGGVLGGLSPLAGAGGAAVGVGVVAAGAAIAKFAADGISSFVKLTDQVRQFQATSGATAQDASKLVFASQALGVPVEALSTSFARLGKNVEENPQKFAALGIGIAHTKDGAVDLYGTFNNVVNKMHEVGTGAEADRIAFDTIGRGAQTIAPLAQQGTDALAKLGDAARAAGAVFDQRQVDEGLKYKEAVHELGTEFGSLEREVGQAAIPALTRLTGWLAESASGWTRITTDVGHAVGAVGNFVGISGDSTSAQERATAATQEQNNALEQQVADAQKAAAAAEQYTAAVNKEVDTILAVSDAQAAAQDADQRVADAQAAQAGQTKDIADARRGLADATATVTDAEQKLADAEAMVGENAERSRIALEKSKFAVQDAQTAYAKAVEEYGKNSEEAQKAALDIQSAQLDQADAQRKVNQPDATVGAAARAVADAKARQADAQAKLNQALAEGPKLQDAVNKAEADFEHATRATVRAQADKNAAIKDGTLDYEAMKKAFDDLITAEIAAGADPATVAHLRQVAADALAARDNLDLMAASAAAAGILSLSPAAASQLDAQIRAQEGLPPLGAPPAPAAAPNTPGQTPPVTAHYDYSVHVTAGGVTDPNELAGIIAFQQTTRH